MQSNGVIYGSHSSNEALKYQCLKKVNIINDLHEQVTYLKTCHKNQHWILGYIIKKSVNEK